MRTGKLAHVCRLGGGTGCRAGGGWGWILKSVIAKGIQGTTPHKGSVYHSLALSHMHALALIQLRSLALHHVLTHDPYRGCRSMYRVCLEMKSSTGWPCSTGVMLSHQILLPPTGWAGVGPCGGLNFEQPRIAYKDAQTGVQGPRYRYVI